MSDVSWSHKNRLLLTILLYGLIITASGLDYNSVYHDEALNILMGRNVLAGEPCPACAQNTGSVLVQPVLAAIGDAVGGLYGARAVGILFGLGLVWIVNMTARTLCSEKLGVISAMIFLFTGTTLYLMKLATYDIIAAFFLGLSFLLIALSEKKHSPFLLLAGAFSLFLASITKYVATVFIVPFLIYVLWRQRPLKAFLFFLLPLLASIVAYTFLALYPAREALLGSSASTYEQSQVPFFTLSRWTFRWVTIPYLLSVFGIFHKEERKTALVLILLSTPIILLHLLTGAEQSVNKNVIFSIVLLAPASALGVEQVGRLFSSRVQSAWVKPFFVVSVLAVVWAFGIHQLRWLERQYPDVSPAIAFFREEGFDGMTVMIDSDYGDAVYAYALYDAYPRALFFPASNMEKKMKPGNLPDFIISDGFYGKKEFRDIAMRYAEASYSPVKDLKLKLSWGIRSVKIFRKR